MHSNKGSLSNIEKLDYFAIWFGEFSEMEKGDFLELIAKKYNDQLDNIDSYNGNLTIGFKKLEFEDRLPSIFKCRIQLFDQWFDEWSNDEREQLLTRIKNLDSDFSHKLQTAIETGRLPQNNLLFCSYDITDEMYEELRKNNQLTNDNSLNSISSNDLLNTSNGSMTNEFNRTNGNGHDLFNGNSFIGIDEQDENESSVYRNGHSNGHIVSSNGHNHSHSEEEEDSDQQNTRNYSEQEDSIENRISSLEIDNTRNVPTFNELRSERIDLAIMSENL